ncbi:MAG: hypothetical protein PHU46_02860 [Rhodocyclaceae bacterium]|nr:hypothetical protein [Rhodocyclaceae bacterium]
MPKYFGLHRWWWWSAEDRRKFKRRLRRISPYLLILLLPGSFFLLPLYALWREWLRRRRKPAPLLADPGKPD